MVLGPLGRGRSLVIRGSGSIVVRGRCVGISKRLLPRRGRRRGSVLGEGRNMGRCLLVGEGGLDCLDLDLRLGGLCVRGGGWGVV